MARGRGTLNKVQLIGRLGADPVVRYTPSGRPNANFNLATNASWKNDKGEVQDRTDWHRVIGWGKLAEVMGEWLKKGSLVYLEGRLQTRSYDDKEGVKRFITEVVVTDMEMLGGKKDETPDIEPVPPEQAIPPVKEDDLPF